MPVDAGRCWQMLIHTAGPMVALQPAAPTFLASRPSLLSLSWAPPEATTDAHTHTVSSPSIHFLHPTQRPSPPWPPEYRNAVTLQPPVQHGACNTTRHRQTLLCARLFRGIRAQGPALLATASRLSDREEEDAGSGVLGCWDMLGRCGLGDAVRIGGELILPVHADTCWDGTMLPKPNERGVLDTGLRRRKRHQDRVLARHRHLSRT